MNKSIEKLKKIIAKKLEPNVMIAPEPNLKPVLKPKPNPPSEYTECEQVYAACPKCRQDYTALCICMAKAFGLDRCVTVDPGSICNPYMPFDKPAYTEDEWVSEIVQSRWFQAGPGNNWADRMWQVYGGGNSWVDRQYPSSPSPVAYGSKEGWLIFHPIPTNFGRMVNDNGCIAWGAASGACCKPGSGLGTNSCEEGLDAQGCQTQGGTFYPGKTCGELDNDNCSL